MVEEQEEVNSVRPVVDSYTTLDEYFSGMGFTYTRTSLFDYHVKNINSKTFGYFSDPSDKSDEFQITLPDDQ